MKLYSALLISVLLMPASAAVGQAPVATPQAGVRPAAAAAQPTTRAWWNDSAVVAKLGLTAEKRRELDQVLSQGLASLKAANVARRELDAKLERAMKARDWAAAELVIAEVERHEQGRVGRGLRLELELLRRLDASQTQKLYQDFPQVAAGGWRMARERGAGRPAGQAPNRAPAPAAAPN